MELQERIAELLRLCMFDRRKIAAEVLNSLPSGELGAELFNAVAKKTVGCCIELVVINGKRPIEVLLKRRADNDTAYPGQWHCPGTFLRPGEGYGEALKRFVEDELAGAKLIEPAVLFPLDPIQEERGSIVQVVIMARIENLTTADDLMWVGLEDACNGQIENMVENHWRSILPYCKAAADLHTPQGVMRI